MGIFSFGMAAERQFFIFGGGSTGGSFFIISNGLSVLFQKYNPDLICTAQVTAATNENLRGVGTGKLHIGLASAPAVYGAFNGQDDFEGEKYDNVRFIMSGFDSPFHIITTPKSGIKSIFDFKGRKIGLLTGVTNSLWWPSMQGFFGLTSENYKTMDYRFEELMNALNDGVVDAVVLSSAVPIVSVEGFLMAQPNSISLPFPKEQSNIITKKFPYFFETVIKGGTYSQFPEDIPTVSSICFIVTNKDVDPDIIYRFTKTVFEHSDELKAIHPMATFFNLENSAQTIKDNLFLPIHPGALKYYKEKGIL